MDPLHRPRRLRRTPALRALVRETLLAPSQFIAPLFVRHGRGIRTPVASMPGVAQLTVDEVLDAEVDALVAAGIGSVILFGIPATKDPVGEENWAPDGIVAQAIRRLKARHPALLVMTDVCCCEYTDHGHCGILTASGEVDNDLTLEVLGRVSVAHSRAGADVLAPSGMMDGMVGAMREALDAAGFADRAILSYAVKYASAYYGPFRDAAGSTPSFGDRRQYQMDSANRREARREVDLDEGEGADMLMVKPALAYLDIIRDVRERSDLPLVCYNVSGEYAMVKAAAQNGWLDERRTVLETLTAMRRAGADAIITYHALDAARWLAEGSQ